jgi:hypothetical protein
MRWDLEGSQKIGFSSFSRSFFPGVDGALVVSWV